MTESRTSRHALVFIFITILVDMTGLGLIIPVLPKLIAELTGLGLSGAARYGGLVIFVYAGMQFFFSPVIGSLSDRFGRRPVLILALVAIGIDYTITALAPTITWLFFARALSGMAGASYTTANAYIADISPPEKRAANFGLVGAAFGLGFIFGPAIGGILGQHDVRLPFFIAAALAMANALYGAVVLTESLPQENRRKFEIWRANPLGALTALRRFPFVLPLCGVIVLMRFAHDANPATWTYYTMLKFHWTTAGVGYSLMAAGAITAVVYGGLTRAVIPLIGEVRAVYFGLACGVLAFAGYAFAAQGWQMYAWMLVGSLVGLSMPALNAIMSKEVGPAEQGELQGAVTSVGSLTSIMAPVAMSYLFAYFTSGKAPVYFPGAAFLAASVCLALAAAVFALVKPSPVNKPAEAIVEQET
ncbi:MAG: TCR/Tet family MFS transporter [Alphaproteobacteria bacterium]|nr:TCR/Tet family MFS transporter [Alphaproteobacteria bacterium]MDE2109925.1 TCR/Tet family MFS transporter [Alphaproteobacteria bacterium]MDE2492646.1 TCR/Tet family MFS transporter [Alphaproteobacteria bacterium]